MTGALQTGSCSQETSARDSGISDALSDSDFVRTFETCGFAAGEFGHRDHLRLAWILLRAQPLARVLERASRGLRRFAQHHGADGIYNETVTWTYSIVINDRIQCEPEGSTSFEAFCRRNPDLLDPVDRFMGSRYRDETWRSEAAKTRFVFPDRRAPLAAPNET